MRVTAVTSPGPGPVQVNSIRPYGAVVPGRDAMSPVADHPRSIAPGVPEALAPAVSQITPGLRRPVPVAYCPPVSAGASEFPVMAALAANAARRLDAGDDAAAVDRPTADTTPAMVLRAYLAARA